MRKILLSILVMMATIAMAQMPSVPKLPVDKAYRIGKLDNGLTYYIRHNEYPANVANFYIAQRVGSIQEEDSQRGLAHFLEHMAFNGSTHYPGDNLIEYTRSLGVAFGADLNAYTSIEQTVYNIDNVPTTRQSALDSCLLILQDWSNGLLLQTEEIDKERGVIHGEWAMRNNATQRLIERNLPAMYPGSKYGYRMPIGTMEVVDNFPPDTLRAYYRKWYHPENQAIIVIGNVDVDYTEAKIKELFNGIKAGPEAAHVVPAAVPDNNEAIYIFDKDKEMQYSIFEVLMKSEPMPKEMKGTQMDYVQAYVTSIISQMFNSRISELAQEPDCPFVQLSLGYGNYLVSSVKECFEVSGVAKEGKDAETFAAIIREIKRVADFGFTASEYMRAKEEFMSQREKAYTNRDKRKNTEYYNDCVENFLHGEAIPDADTEYQIWQMLSQNIPVDVINQSLSESLTIDNDTNLVCFGFAQEKEGRDYLTTDEMKAIVEKVRGEQLQAWVDNTKDEPIVDETKLPKAGKIKSETKNDVLGYTELTLSNGAKVIMKKTDFKDNEVTLSAWAPGGECLYGEKDYDNLQVFSDVTRTFGLGNFTNNELEKALAGKQANVNYSLTGQASLIAGNSTPKDLETLMQLLYLSFTAPQKDEKAYTTLYNMYETQLKNRDLQPETQFSDSISIGLYAGNARKAPLTVEHLKNVSLDRCLAIAKERFSNVNNFTFSFVGNFDEAQLREFVCKYIAVLPGKEKKVKTSFTTPFFKGSVNKHFTRKMETPKPYLCTVYISEQPCNAKDEVIANCAGEVLSNILIREVRENASAAYSVSASSALTSKIKGTNDPTYAVLQVIAPISAPEKMDLALDIIAKEVQKLSEKTDAEILAKVKANMLKDADVDAKKNGYWQSVIRSYNVNGLDEYTEYKKNIESVTPEMVSNFVKKILASNNKLSVVMRPE